MLKTLRASAFAFALALLVFSDLMSRPRVSLSPHRPHLPYAIHSHLLQIHPILRPHPRLFPYLLPIRCRPPPLTHTLYAAFHLGACRSRMRPGGRGVFAGAPLLRRHPHVTRATRPILPPTASASRPSGVRQHGMQHDRRARRYHRPDMR